MAKMLTFESLLKGEFNFFFLFLIFCHLLVAVGVLGAVHGTMIYTTANVIHVPVSLN